MEIKGQITKLLKDLNKGVYEKEEVIALTLLTAIAGESIFLLGAPGVAKSLIARRLKFGFKDGTSFEYLMNRFSTPDEIFGPVSISKLKDEDKYERIVKNYLPTATVVFLDEIWKAGPSIQNALLTVLNEKVYRNGDQEIKVPMKSLISASNELPMKGEGLEALWDRFLVRYVVDGITDKDSFNEMISKSLNSYDDNVSTALKLTDDQYNKISEEIDKVEIPENVLNVIHIIRNYVNQHNKKDEKQENQIYISDRRWRKIVRLLRTSAFLNDRKAVDLMDCFLIAHCIWNEPEQFAIVLQFTKDAIQKHGYKLEIDLKDLKEELDDFNIEVKNYCNDNRKETIDIQKIFYSEFYNIPTLNYTLLKINDFNSFKRRVS
jgi:MoxR-like ATPase